MRNQLLAAIPPDEFALLQGHLQRVDLPIHQVLHLPNEPITAVYFPQTGWVSMLASLELGDSAEVGLIGREGMVGTALLFETDRSPMEAMVQGGGEAHRMGAEAFSDSTRSCPVLRRMLLRFSLALQAQVSQTAACNSRHVIEQRLARWLLMAHDRAGTEQFAMTHEFMSMMLGVRRASISIAAGMLQKAGLIRYSAGKITVTDRAGLEAGSCECYHAVRQEYVRLLGTAKD